MTKIQDLPEEKYIYESPDGGKTWRARKQSTDEVVYIYDDPDIKKQRLALTRLGRLADIVDLAETNPTLNDALKQLEELYILIKDNENDK